MPVNMTAHFDDVVTLAQFCAELVRQGVTFEAETYTGGWRVRFTGGY